MNWSGRAVVESERSRFGGNAPSPLEGRFPLSAFITGMGWMTWLVRLSPQTSISDRILSAILCAAPRGASEVAMSDEAFAVSKSEAMDQYKTTLTSLWSRIEEPGVAEKIQEIELLVTDIETCVCIEDLAKIISRIDVPPSS